MTNEQFFAEQVWAKVAGAQCIACHSSQGVAAGSDYVLQDAYQTGFLEHNYRVLEDLATLEKDGEPLLLVKPTGGDAHGGSVVFEEGSEEEQIMREMIERFESPVASCGSAVETVTDELVLLTPEETLRKATLSLVGRLPTDGEIQVVQEAGLNGLDAVLLKQMEEEAFLIRLKEVYNDLFLTDRYLGGDEATDLLDEDDYPYRRWYDPRDDDPVLDVDPSYMDLGDRYANNSGAREPLELLAHIVDNDRPFTEVVTADYTVVNPFSAHVYGVFDRVEWDDATDPNEWREVKLPNVNHAGVFTSHMWLNRFPTTDTNVNRHRSRIVFDMFLATDVLRLAERPIDPTSIKEHNPTMNSSACNVCHAQIDPIAGVFQNWDDEGRQRPRDEGWHTDMVPPGFNGENLPFAEIPRALQWFGERLIQDRRFTTAAVHKWYTALTGNDPLRAPTDFSAEDYSQQMANYLEQDAVFQAIGDEFEASNYNIKTVILGIVRSEYYRATGINMSVEELDANPSARAKLSAFGTERWLTPEQLNRKIVAVTGYPWKPRSDRQDYLRDLDQFRIFYGGIDSDSITARITEPNGLMGNIASLMSNQMACLAVPQDFVLPAEERLLFPHVEASFTPEDISTGFAVAQSVQAIKENIQYLHKHVLGEDLPLEHPEIERTYALFYETWREGVDNMGGENGLSENLDGACQADENYWSGEDYPEEMRVESDSAYTIRAWMAVMTYMLGDYRFLHE